MTVKRVTFLQDFLAFMGLEGRLHLEWLSSAEAQKFVQVVTQFTEKIRGKGPSPMSIARYGHLSGEPVLSLPDRSEGVPRGG